ncbi:MAG: hypothetical protein DRQ41_00005, partial [Gammaproteobacteria bacterium]
MTKINKHSRKTAHKIPLQESDSLMLALEPRILFDAAAVLTMADEFQDDQSTTPVEDIMPVMEDSQTDSSSDDLLQATAELNNVPRQELVFIDPAVYNHDSIIADIRAQSSDEVELQIIVLDKGENGIQQISHHIEGQSNIDAIHILSHADDGTILLGQTQLDSDNLTSYTEQLATWQDTLNDDADILLYGCSIAETQTGIDFVQNLSEITQADITASNDNTGHTNLGGDWHLEYQTGPIETNTLQSDANTILAPTPLATVTSATPMLNEEFSLTVSFDNTGAAGETGYGPFFDMVIGSGLDMDLTPQYFGDPIDPALVQEIAVWNGTEWVEPDGTPVTEHLYTGFSLPTGSALGDRYVLVQLPFGSFVENQPVAELSFNGTARGQNYDGDGADPKTDWWDGSSGLFPLMVPDNVTQPDGAIPYENIPVWVRGGFRFGTITPIDDAKTDTPIVGAANTGNITPQLIKVTKTVDPVAEGVTGPNFGGTFNIDIDIATGVTVNGINIIDDLPNDIVYQDNLTLTGATLSGSVNVPDSVLAPLNLTASKLSDVIDPAVEVTGGSGNDISLSFKYYTPEYDADDYDTDGTVEDLDLDPITVAGNQAGAGHDFILDPTTGDDATSTNPNPSGVVTATVNIATDTNNDSTPDLPGYTGDIIDLGNPTPISASIPQKSIAIQKDVAAISGNNGPNSLLEYTLTFEVSDYFAFDDVVITDTFSDGQRLDQTFTPTIEIQSGHPDLATAVSAGNHSFDGFTTGATGIVDADVTAGWFSTGPGNSLTATNFTATLNAAPDNAERPAAGTASYDGSTELVFNVSDELDLFDAANNGIFKGAGANVDYRSAAIPSVGTTVTIKYRTVVQEEFSDFHISGGSGDPSIDTLDNLDNSATIEGTLVDPHNGYTSLGTTEDDDARADVEIPGPEMFKEIYAINGETTYADPPRLGAGDFVTYRVTTIFPTADTEGFTIIDYLPLPVFDMSTKPIAGSILDHGTGTGTGGLPAGGEITYGPAHTLYGDERVGGSAEADAPGPWTGYGASPVYTVDSINPTVSVNVDNNQLLVDFGQFDTEPSIPAVIDLLFTVEATDIPFAHDGFFLTNQAESTYGNTKNSGENVTEIVQILMIKPDLVVTKGGVVTSNPAETFTPAVDGVDDIAYLGTGTTTGFTGLISSGMLGTDDQGGADTDIENVDAGDIVRFSIAIENQGGKGAYDLQIRDTIPSGFEIPTAGLNLAIALGNDHNTAVTWVDDQGGTDASRLFEATGYIEIVDDGDGVIAAGYTDGKPSTIINDGSNIIIVTYDLRIADTAAPAEPISNNVELINYSHKEGGDDHTDNFPSDNFSDDATVTIAPPSIAKALTNSSESSTTGSNFTIGEVATYQLTVTVPEGTMPNMSITDDIPEGMAYVSGSASFIQNAFTGTINGSTDSSVTIANDWTVTNSGGDGDNITFVAKGDVVPTATTASSDTSFILEYQAVVLDIDSNDKGDTLTNTATLSYPDPDTDSISESTSGVDINIVEPNLSISKDIDIAKGDAGDPLTITLTVENTGTSDAFDVVITDLLDSSKYTNVAVTTPQNGFTADFGTTTANTVTFSGGTITADSSKTFTFTANLATGVEVGETLTNTANITESSTLPGIDTNERDQDTESNSDNKYTGNDDDTVTIDSPITVDKVLNGTGQNTTDNKKTQAVIGETVQYTTTITVPEGTMQGATIVDTLDGGLAFVRVDSITASAGLSTSISGGFDGGAGSVLETATFSDAAQDKNDGRILTLDFGTLTNTDTDNATTETIEVTYTAVVINHSTAAAGNQRNNEAAFNWDSNPNTDPIIDTADNVRIRESLVEVTVDVSDPTPDSGDTITYTLTIDHTGTGHNVAEAYEVNLTDMIPTGLTYVDGTLTHDGGLTPTSLSESGGKISANWDTFANGDTPSVLTFDVTVNSGATSGGTITNEADIEWTSLPGDVMTTPVSTHNSLSVERTGDDSETGGSQNDYNGTNDVVITVPVPQPGKTIIDTSEDHTSNDTSDSGSVNLAVGEIARYQVIVELPEASMPDLKLIDTLGTGLTFLNDGNVTVSFNSDTTPTFSNTDITGAYPGNPDAFTLPSNLIDYTDNVITFDFDDVTNNDTDGSGSVEQLIIEYNVIAANTTDVDRGNTLINSAQLSQGGSDLGSAVTVDANVVEPNISLAIDNGNVTTADAGDTVTYTITVTSDNDTNAATAFDLQIKNAIPDELEIQSVSYSNLPAYLTDGTDITASGLAYSGQNVTIDVDELHENDTFDIVVTTKVRDTGVDIIQASETVTNTADLTYTSLPGTGTTITNSVGTNSNTGTAGDADGERTGSGTAPNDYTGTDNNDLTTPDPIITKVLSVPATTNYTIGETFEYTVTLTVPEGRTGDTLAQVTDVLDAGLTYVPGTLVVTPGANITVGEGGTLDDTNTGVGNFFNRDNSGGDTSSESLTFDFDYIDYQNSNAVDGLNTGTVTIKYQVRVDNIVENQNAATPNNTATLIYTDPAGGADLTVNDIPGNADTQITIIEPDLEVEKTVLTDTSGVEAGDLVQYQIVVRHTAASTADAFDIDLNDPLPVKLNALSLISATHSGAGDVIGNFTITGNILNNTIGDIDLAQGETLTLVVQGTVVDTIQPAEIIGNTATATWSSLDDSVKAGGAEERDGDNSVVDADDYTADSSINVTIVDGFVLTKTIDSITPNVSADLAKVSPGDVITYQLEVEVVEGTTHTLVIDDHLPAGTTYITDTAVVASNPASMTFDALTFTDNSGTLEIRANSVTNPGNDTDPSKTETDSFFITYDVQVTDASVPGDVDRGDTLINDADGSVVLADSSTLTDNDNQITVTVVEPELIITKTADVSTGDASDVVTYTVTVAHTGNSDSPAYDLEINDLLDNVTGLTLVDGSVTIDDGTSIGTPAIDIGNGGSDTKVQVTTDVLEVGETLTITYQVKLDDTVIVDEDLTSTVTVDYDNQLGSVTEQRAYAPESAEHTVTVGGVVVSKSVVETMNDPTPGDNSPDNDHVTIGEKVTYRFTVTLPEGVTPNLVIDDSIPDGMAYVPGSVQVFQERTDTSDHPAPNSNHSGTGETAIALEGGATVSAPTVTRVSDNAATPFGDGEDVRFVFDSIEVESDDDVNTNTFYFTYEAVVLDKAANTGLGTQTTLTAPAVYEANATDTSNPTITAAVEIDYTDGEIVTVVEPDLAIIKTVNVDNGGAVDDHSATGKADNTAVYEITIKHDDATVTGDDSTSTAYDVTFTDPLSNKLVQADGTPLEISDVTVIHSNGDNITNKFEIAADGQLQTKAGESFDLALTENVVITVNAVLRDTVVPSEVINSDATATFNSLPGDKTDNDQERSSSVDDDEPVTVPDYVPIVHKSLVSTSETDTSNADVAVGEIARYRLVVSVDENILNNLQVEDHIAPGLQFLNDDTARFGFISTGGDKIASSAITDIAAVSGGAIDGDKTSLAGLTSANVTGTFGDSNISKTITGAGTGDIYADGEDVYFRFGNLVNSDDDANVEYVVIEYNALVLNVAGNQAGTTIDNDFAVLRDSDGNGSAGYNNVNIDTDGNGDGDSLVNANDPSNDGSGTSADSNVVQITVVEPSLANPVKALVSVPSGGTTVDAGDTITYSLSVTNSGDASAYEVIVNDVLDDDLTFGAIGAITVNAGSVPTVTESHTDNDFNFEMSEIEVGQTVTFEFTAIVNSGASGVSIAELISNTSSLTEYTSLPGDGTLATDFTDPNNPTGSSTPGAEGSETGERDGDSDVVGGTNDYEGGDGNTIDLTVNGPLIDKVNPAKTGYAVGEVVTYTINVSLPEGVTEDLVITDAIPSGLGYIGHTLVNSNSMTSANISANQITSVTSSGTLGTDGANVIFDLSNVTTPGDTTTQRLDLTIQVQALVLNVAENQNGDTFDEAASLTYTDPDGSTNNGNSETITVSDSDPSNDPALNVIEPVLTITHKVTDPDETTQDSVTSDGGDAITYTITIQHDGTNSSADAFDLALTDAIPSEIKNPVLATALINGTTDVSGSLDLTGQNLTTTADAIDLAQTQTLVITITGSVDPDEVMLDKTITNDAELTWTSVDGSSVGSSYLNDGSDTERDGSDGENGALNDYAGSEDAEIVINPYTPIVNKQIVATSESTTTETLPNAADAAIGEVVRYRLVTSLPEGTVENLQIQEHVPDGMRFLGNANIAVVVGSSVDSVAITGTTDADSITLPVIADLGSVTSTAITGTFNDNNIDIVSTGNGDNDNFADGTDVFFRLGNLVNNDNDADVEYVVIEYDVLVLDVSANISNVPLVNDYTVLYDSDGNGTPGYTDVNQDTDGDGDGDNVITATDTDNDATSGTDTPANSNTNTVTVVTPELNISKTAELLQTTITESTLKYTLTLDHTAASTADAFDLVIDDVITDADLHLTVGTVQVSLDGGTNFLTLPTAGVTVNEGNTAGDTTLQVKIDSYALSATDDIVITYEATYDGASSHVANIADLDYDTLAADSDPNERLLEDQDDVNMPIGATIGDFVWMDANGDGNQDEGAGSGIANVTIALYEDTDSSGDYTDGTDTLVNTQTTDSEGAYDFTGLNAGTYIVRVTDTHNVLNSFTPTSPAMDTQVVTVAAGDDHDVADFGYQDPQDASIGDLVWHDLDGDGVYDSGDGETGIDGVTINLYRDENGNGVIDPTETTVFKTTDTVNGDYIFTDLAVGSYIVEVDENDLPTNSNLTSLDAEPHPVTLTVSQVYEDADFGYQQGNGSIGNFIWLDTDGEGDQDEAGVEDVTVDLYRDTNGNGTIDGAESAIATETTDSSGAYEFTGLIAGDYIVKVTDTGNVLDGYNVTGDPDATKDGETAVNLATDDTTVDTADFGYQAPAGSIGERVFVDLDQDGIFDAGETGLQNVTVDLYQDLNANGTIDTSETVFKTDTTDADGLYNFAALPAGNYIVKITDDNALLDAYTPVSGTERHVYALSDGEDYNEANFGYLREGSIGDKVWNDQDGDGNYEPDGDDSTAGTIDDEKGIAGVTLNLYRDTNANGTLETGTDEKVTSTTTDENGDYHFYHLDADNYFVDVVDTSPALADLILTTTNDPTAMITLNSGDDHDAADFGYQDPANARIGDLVWHDLDGDGNYEPLGEDGVAGGGDDETGLANVTVKLYKDDGDGSFDAGTDLLVTPDMVTAADGSYEFTGLSAGTYFVVPTDPELDGFALTGGTTPHEVTLGVGQNYSAADFGYRQSDGRIGDIIWHDEDGDGSLDGGETGINGVTLNLYQDENGDGVLDDGDTLLDNTTTAANGSYEFTGLLAGHYLVEVSDTSGVLEPYIFTSGTSIGASPLAVELPTSSTDYQNADFGYQREASIGDTVWNDLDNDGVQDEDGADNDPATLNDNERGISNVTLNLYQDTNSDNILGSEDTYITTTTTDANGNYDFQHLTPGDYLVKVTDDQGMLVNFTGTTNTTNVPGKVWFMTVAAGDDHDAADFGFNAPSDASIGDTVWYDLNGNGVQDTGESGIANVDVNLYLDADGDGVADTGELIATDTTDGNGEYLFSNLHQENYLVLVDTSDVDFPANHVLTDGTISHAVDLRASVNYPDADFGYQAPAGSIGDYVWFDSNGNGVQDGGESGISDATVTVVWAGVDNNLSTTGDNETFTTTTNASGYYQVSNLPAGTYQVTVSGTPSQYIPSSGSESVGSSSETLSLTAGENKEDVDFGYKQKPALPDNHPQAEDDSASTDENVPVTTVDVLLNDDKGDTPTTMIDFDETSINGGQVVYNDDGTFTYTPKPGFSGTDAFDYTITDKDGDQSTATVTITINALPEAVDDSANTNINTPVTIEDILTNDDQGDAPATITNFDNTSTQGGNVVEQGDGTFIYTPAIDFTGTDTFDYTITDNNGDTSTATVSVVVNAPTNPLPIAVDDSTTTPVNTPVVVDALNNDTAGDAPATITSTTSAPHGTVVIKPDGTLIYTPDSDFVGTDTFDYTITDNNGDTSTATVTVSITPVVGNLLPVAVDDSVTTLKNVPITTAVLNNDNLGDAPATVTDITQGSHGQVQINPDGTVTYTPEAGFIGNDSYTYIIQDNNGDTSTATVNVSINDVFTPPPPVNHLPEAVDDNTSTDENVPVTTSVLKNDAPGDGPASVTSVTQAANGTVKINPDGTVTYTPDPDFNGDDSYTYTIKDNDGDTSTATVNIVVNPNPGTITGQVRLDSDADGDLSDNDSGITGVAIALYSDADGDGKPDSNTPVAITTTDANGNYLFDEVEPGNYVIVETNPNGYDSTKDTQGSNDD